MKDTTVVPFPAQWRKQTGQIHPLTKELLTLMQNAGVLSDPRQLLAVLIDMHRAARILGAVSADSSKPQVEPYWPEVEEAK